MYTFWTVFNPNELISREIKSQNSEKWKPRQIEKLKKTKKQNKTKQNKKNKKQRTKKNFLIKKNLKKK